MRSGPGIKIVWTKKMITFLEENYKTKTNQELADALNLKITATRKKLYTLGLRKMQLEYWSPEMIDFLKKSYKVLGDVEIMDYFKKAHPKTKGWKRGSIWKKRKQMGLKRTPEEKAVIVKRHLSIGGRCFTILKVSGSLNLKPAWIATIIAPKNRPLQKELLKHPDIIEAAKNLLLLKRMIKQKSNEA
jgi:hypothetical protein